MECRMDRLDSLRVFVAVAELRGFAPAARQLGFSPPAVTRAVGALEQRIGAQLVQRTTRSVRLTDVGTRFFEDCRRILGELTDAEAEAGGAFASPQGQLAVTAPALFGRLHVAPVLLDFLAEQPGVTARCFFVDRIVNLHDEGFDVAVRIAHLPDSGLTAVRVGAVRRVVVASPEYLAVHGTPSTPIELVNHAAIGFSQTGMTNEPWSFYPPGRKQRGDRELTLPRVQLIANASEVAIAGAVRGRGLTRALSYQVAADLEAGRLRILLADFEPDPIPVHLVFAAGRKAPAKVRAFVDFAVERLRREPVLSESGRPVA
jgi:DNA-binding transcriptional LysR family regulator